MIRRMIAGLFVLAAYPLCAQPLTVDVELTARGRCQDRMATLPADLPAARDVLLHDLTAGGWNASVTDLQSGQAVTAQAWLDMAGGVATRATVYWPVPGDHPDGSTASYRVTLGNPQAPAPPAGEGLSVERTADEIVVTTPEFTVHHGLHSGGMITRVDYGADASRALPLTLNDRLYSEGSGAFSLRSDPSPEVEVLAAGPLVAVVRTRAHYCSGDGTHSPGEAEATYTFTYSALDPTVRMKAEVRQEGGPAWEQIHVFEMYHKTAEPFFTDVASSPPLETEKWVDEHRTVSLRGKQWGALLNDRDALALLGPDLYGIHLNLSGHGIYVHGPWQSFPGGSRTWEATLYLGPSGGSPEALAQRLDALSSHWQARVQLPEGAAVVVSPAQAREQIRGVVGFASRLGPEGREAVLRQAAVGLWLADAAERASGSLVELYRWERLANAAAAVASEVEGLIARGQPVPPSALAYQTDDMVVLAGDGTALHLERTDEGMGLRQIGHLAPATDQAASADMLALGAAFEPLWSLTFRNPATGELATVGPQNAAGTSWQVTDADGVAQVAMVWSGCSLGDRADALDVTATVRQEPASALSRWTLELASRAGDWGLWQIEFPRIGPVGPGGRVCVPSKWGTVMDLPMSGGGYRGAYPSQGAFGQLMCYWREGSGLYYGAHDPSAGAKTFAATPAGADGVTFSTVTWPADMGLHMPRRELGYEVAVGAYSGDWFDAAKIYRQWATQQFWCRQGPNATRADMPQWWRDCSLCIRPTGDPDWVTQMGTNLQAAFDMPAVLHWYKWHQIPFDNDYPEYFPVVEGFGDAVTALQAVGVNVMPYVNGHLWDTDTASWTAENAAAGACRDINGGLYLEHWQQQDHAVMCPTSEVFQHKMREIGVRLVQEYGCKCMYLDQIGASSPRLCFATNHGHPVGGGDFWVQGYDQLLGGLREAARAIEPDFIMTTESQAEPYMAQLDGFLMCNLVGANQVPLYTAIYGGWTQTFGRAGEWGDPPSFYMEQGQAFAFGSMMGRIATEDLLKPENAAMLRYLKSLAELRRDYSDFMALGEMLRPPALEGDVPTVTSQWHSKTQDVVTMGAIQRAAWRAPDGRFGLFFTNVSQEPVALASTVSLADLGWQPTKPKHDVKLHVVTVNGDDTAVPELVADAGQYHLSHTLLAAETVVVVIEVD